LTAIMITFIIVITANIGLLAISKEPTAFFLRHVLLLTLSTFQFYRSWLITRSSLSFNRNYI